MALKRISLTAFAESERERLRAAIAEGVKKARALSHPNIAAVVDAVDEPESVSILSEFIDGESLAAMWARNSLPPKGALLHFLRQAGEALDYAHRRGVFHGTVKPANIVVAAPTEQAERSAKLTGFGLGPFLAAAGAHPDLGPGGDYRSPEQQEAGALDARSDQYSLAASVYMILCGKPPCPADGERNGHQESIRDLNESLSASAEKVLLRALSKSPADRFPSCANFVSTLNIALGENPAWSPSKTAGTIAAVAIPTPPPEPTPARRSEIQPPPPEPLEAASPVQSREPFNAREPVKAPDPVPLVPAETPFAPPITAATNIQGPVLNETQPTSLDPEPTLQNEQVSSAFVEEPVYWPIPDPEPIAAPAPEEFRSPQPLPPAEPSATRQRSEPVLAAFDSPQPASQQMPPQPVERLDSEPQPRPIILPMLEDTAARSDDRPLDRVREHDSPARRRRHARYGDSEDADERGPRKKSLAPRLLVGLIACLGLILFALYETGWRPKGDLPAQVLDTNSGPATPAPSDGLPAASKNPAAAPQASTPQPVPDAGERPRTPNGAPDALSQPSQNAGLVQEEFLSDPPGAKITVDNRPDLACTAPCSLQLTNGRHTASAVSTGYNIARRIFSVPEDTSLFIPMTRNAGILVLTSTPSGSTIVVDGQQQGQTPATLHLSAGKHQIVLLYGAMRHEESITIESDGFQARSLNWEAP